VAIILRQPQQMGSKSIVQIVPERLENINQIKKE